MSVETVRSFSLSSFDLIQTACVPSRLSDQPDARSWSTIDSGVQGLSAAWLDDAIRAIASGRGRRGSFA